MKKAYGVATAGAVALAAAFSFASVTEAEAKGKARVKPVAIKSTCVYATLICPAVVMDGTGNRYDISGLKRPNANPVSVVGVPGATSLCGTKLSPGTVRAVKGAACILPLRLF